MKYLVTGVGSNGLYVGDIRIFDSEGEAWEYAGELRFHATRVYIVSKDAPPILLKKPKGRAA